MKKWKTNFFQVYYIWSKKVTNTKLVLEKLEQNSLIENNKMIWNCFLRKL